MLSLYVYLFMMTFVIFFSLPILSVKFMMIFALATLVPSNLVLIPPYLLTSGYL